MSSTPGPSPGPAGIGAPARPSIPDYELVRVVGRGSYGDVWLARGVTGGWRAIKVVWRDRFADAEPFEREFRGLKEFAEVSLGESSQMALLHVGRNDAAGFFYYAMELADDAEQGRRIDPATYVPLTLAELRLRRGRIAADECARFGVELARVLATLHRRGLVHRDVKPSNVILVSGVPKLADVGLVAPSSSARTFVGTEGYVPPEGPGAPSADVFALGKVLYELSTGHDRQEFPKLPHDLARLPDRAALLELNEILLRACGPASAGRYRDGAAILADLTALHGGVSLRTRRVLTGAGRAVAILVVATALGWGGWRWYSHRGPAPVPTAAGISPRSLAVLPLANATGDAAQGDYAVGLSDEILHALERERELRVAGSWASLSFRDTKLPAMEIARRLHVAQLVEGSLERVGSRLRLQVRLTRGLDGASESLGPFEREAAEVFALEDDVARAVAQKTLQRVTQRALPIATRNAEAYAEFLRGRALQVRGMRYWVEAANRFRHATELDPQFAAAWARLADALRGEAQKNLHGRWPDDSDIVRAASRAYELQPNLPLALTVRSFVRGVGQNETADGLHLLDSAEAIGGSNAETCMTRFLVNWFAGEAQGLLPVAREAIALNPENIERLTVAQLALWYLGDYAEADRLYQQPAPGPLLYEQADSFVARVYLRRTWRGAAAAARLAERAAPNAAAGLALRAHMLGELGRGAEVAKLLEGVTEPLPWQVYADAGLDDRARARAEIELPELRQKFAAFDGVPFNDTVQQRKEEACSRLIAAEIELGHRDAARALLDAWWGDVQQRRKPNRRSGGFYLIDLPRYYALLGQPDGAIAILQQFKADGRSLGYDLRDSACYAALGKDPRFQELRQQAEALAAMQPEPADEPRLSGND